MSKAAENREPARPFQIYPSPHSLQPLRVERAPRVYRAPWHGELVLACRKCQKKIRKRGGSGALGKVSRWFKRRTKGVSEAQQVRVLDVPCVKMCPEGGVTVFSAQQLARQPAGVCILRSEREMESFYQALAAPQHEHRTQR